MIKLTMPEFKTEREEAAWWFNNQDAVSREYFNREPTPEFRNELCLMMDPEDFRMAQEQAEQSGALFEDYLRRVLHEALLARK